MKKLLMFLVLLTVSVGTWAYSGTGSETNISFSEVDEIQGQPGSAKQVIVSYIIIKVKEIAPIINIK